MILNLPSDTAQGLEAIASAQGLSIGDYLHHLVARELPARNAAISKRIAPEEWAHQFEEWADSFPMAAPLSDDAISRENLYPDRL